MAWRRWDWNTPTEREDTEYSFFCSFSLLGMLCYVIFHRLCSCLDYSDVWHCSQPPALNVGVLTIALDIPDVTFTWPPVLIHWSQVQELQYSWVMSSYGCYRDSSYFSLALLPHVCAHKNLQLLKLGPSWLLEHLSVEMFCRCWVFTKPIMKMLNLQFAHLWRKILASFP